MPSLVCYMILFFMPSEVIYIILLIFNYVACITSYGVILSISPESDKTRV